MSITTGAFSRLCTAAPKLALAMIPDGNRKTDAVAGLDEPWFQGPLCHPQGSDRQEDFAAKGSDPKSHLHVLEPE